MRRLTILSSILVVCSLALLSRVAVADGVITVGATQVAAKGSSIPILTWSTTPAATSCAATGGWTGVKAASGSETEPAITTTTSYTLTCQFPASNSATVNWLPPATRTDGSALNNGAGFNIYYSNGAGAPTVLKVAAPTATTQVVSPLAAGTWSFTMTSLDTNGNESAQSTAVTKVISGTTSDTKTITVTIVPVPSVITTLSVQ